MKRLLFFILLFAASFLQAQDKAEYFIDTDPGVGNGIEIPVVVAGNIITANANIPTTGLSAGFHNLFVRTFVDAAWGIVEARMFYVSNLAVLASDITTAEYFIDADPGVGNGTPMSVGAANGTVSFTSVIPTTGLQSGFHTLSIRIRDVDGNWSAFEQRMFFLTEASVVASDIVAAEYFFDIDPGHGIGTVLNIGASGGTVSFASVIPTTGLSNGFHNLSIRMLNANGKWGHFESRLVYVSNAGLAAADIDAAEYFIDTDPGVGSGTALNIGSIAGVVNFTAAIATTGLTKGFHNLSIRAKSTDGLWGNFENRMFYIGDQGIAAADITAAEYFIDTDPGLGMGTAISIPVTGSTVALIAAIPTTGLSNGVHSLFIRAFSTDGWGVAEKKDFTIAVSTTPPAIPVITSINASGTSPVLTNNNKPVFSGTSEVETTVQLFFGSTVLTTVTTNASGNWTFTPAAAIADGVYVVTAKATNTSLLTSDASLAFTLTIDTQVPASTIITAINGNTTQGTTITNSQPVVTGTAEAGATVTIFNGVTVIGTVIANGSGNYTFTPSGTLPDGNYVLTANATDLAGNTNATGTSFSFTIDTQAPGTPVIVSVDGNTSQGNSFNNNKPVIRGTAEALNSVEIFNGAISIGTTTSNASGNFVFTPLTELPDGNYSVTAKAKDAGGILSPVSTVFSFNIDTQAPVAIILTVGIANNSGTSIANNTPVITGTTEPNAVVDVFNGGTSLGTVTADASGNFSFTPPVVFSEGTAIITVNATDRAGNTGAASTSFSVTIDTQVPPTPVIVTVDGNTASGIATVNNKPVINGSAEPGSQVELFNGPTSLGVVTADVSGNYTFTPITPLTDGTYTITAVTSDAAGNESTNGNTFTFIIDTQPPAVPLVVTIDNNPAINILTTNARPVITGSAEPGVAIELFNGPASFGSVTADASGNYTFTPVTNLIDGAYIITAVSKDILGNVSAPSNAHSFILDTQVPLAPVIITANGIGNQGGVTGNNKPEIKGTAEAGTIVEFFNGAASLGTTTVDASGNYTFISVTALPDNVNNITAKTKDKAGNTSPASTVFIVTIDTQSPASPAITTIDGVANGSATLNNRPVITGNAEPLTTVQLFNGSILLGSGITDAAGKFAFTPASDLAVGTYSITAIAKDAAGNSSVAGPAFIIKIDPSNPQVTSNNVLTPNGDGKNDFLIVNNLQYYPENKLTIFDRAGRVIYTTTSYQNNWNGAVGSSMLAEGTYYFIIDLGPKTQPFKSFITIIRKSR